MIAAYLTPASQEPPSHDGNQRVENLKHLILAYDSSQRATPMTLSLAELFAKTSAPWPRPAVIHVDGVDCHGHTITQDGIDPDRFYVWRPTGEPNIAMERVTLDGDNQVTAKWGQQHP